MFLYLFYANFFFTSINDSYFLPACSPARLFHNITEIRQYLQPHAAGFFRVELAGEEVFAGYYWGEVEAGEFGFGGYYLFVCGGDVVGMDEVEVFFGGDSGE